MIDYLMEINLCVFVYGLVAIMINWYLKGEIIIADILTALSIIVVTIWHVDFIIPILGGILTFLLCFYRNQITIYLQRKMISVYGKRTWIKYLFK